MPRRFWKLTMTPEVLELQDRTYGATYAPEDGGDEPDTLGDREREFIAERDSFYMASIGSGGWPYLQHRGGPTGFLKVVDERHLAFADYRGNRQLLTAGNTVSDPRVSLFLMDYAGRRRLKLLGRATFLPAHEAPALARLVAPDDPSITVERVVRIEVEAWDWNCPKHITQRYIAAEVEAYVAARDESR